SASTWTARRWRAWWTTTRSRPARSSASGRPAAEAGAIRWTATRPGWPPTSVTARSRSRAPATTTAWSSPTAPWTRRRPRPCAHACGPNAAPPRSSTVAPATPSSRAAAPPPRWTPSTRDLPRLRSAGADPARAAARPPPRGRHDPADRSADRAREVRRRRRRQRQEGQGEGDVVEHPRPDVGGDRADEEQHQTDRGGQPEERQAEQPQDQTGDPGPLQDGEARNPAPRHADL